MNINRFLAAMAVATALGSPALAQSYDPDLGTGNVAPAPTSYVDTAPGITVFAQAPRAEVKHIGQNSTGLTLSSPKGGNVEADRTSTSGPSSSARTTAVSNRRTVSRMTLQSQAQARDWLHSHQRACALLRDSKTSLRVCTLYAAPSRSRMR